MPITNYETESTREPLILDSDTLVALDVDRTLLKSESLSTKVYAALRQMFPESQAVVDAVESEEAINKGMGYEYLAEFENKAGVALSIEALVEKLADEASIDELADDILVEGAVELIDKIKSTTAKMIYWTYGDDKTQDLKVRLLKTLFKAKTQSQTAVESYMIMSGRDQHGKKLPKHQAFTSVYDEVSGSFDVTKLSDTIASQSYLAPSLLAKPPSKVVIIDDKTENQPPQPTWQLRGVLAVAAGMDDDGDPRRESLQEVTQRIA